MRQCSFIGLLSAVGGLTSVSLAGSSPFDGNVSAKIVAFNAASARAELFEVSGFVTSGSVFVDLESTGVVPNLPFGTFELAINEVDAVTRELTVAWSFLDPIVPMGTTFEGLPLTQLAFEFGTPSPLMDPLLAEPGAVVEVLSQSGSLGDVNGNTFDVGGFIFLGAENGGLVGVNAFILPDSDGNPTDVGNAGWNHFEASAVYRVIPAPAASGLLALAGLAAARRR